MRRVHVIDGYDRMGGEVYYREEKFAHDPELREAYECGRKTGWREAMEESERRGGYHERLDWRTMPPMMRESDRGWDDDEVSYRRGRDSMGRYIRR